MTSENGGPSGGSVVIDDVALRLTGSVAVETKATAMRPATVVAADDHPLYRAALGDAISACPELELLELAPDGRQALEAIRRHLPDVVVLDVRMPELGGQDVVRRMRHLGLGGCVLFISEYRDGDVVLDSLTAGGAGYLAKTATAEEIRTAIKRVAAGKFVLPSDVGTELASAIREHGRSGVRLSERELTVLQLIANGDSARVIAGQLHLAVPTVKTHIQHVYTKLGVGSRGAAVAEAMRRGLVA